MNGMRFAMRVGEFAFGPLHTALWGMALKKSHCSVCLMPREFGGGASNTYLGPGRGPRGHDVWPLGGKKGSAFDVFVRLRTALVPGLVKTALFWCFHLNFTRLARFRCRRAISHRNLEIAQFGLN